MKIIGLSGKKQSGKTTAADFLSHMTKWPIISIAQPLKGIIKHCFGATEEQLNGTDEQKNTKLDCGKSARELMQIVGTDMFRLLDANCWLRCLDLTLQRFGASGCIIPDVRFVNELEWIHDRNGHVIRLLRAPFLEKDKHISETELDWLDGEFWNPPESDAARKLYSRRYFDYFIDNRAISIDASNAIIWDFVTERKWI